MRGLGFRVGTLYAHICIYVHCVHVCVYQRIYTKEDTYICIYILYIYIYIEKVERGEEK